MSALVFATRTYAEMAAEICWLMGAERGVVEQRDFPDGERWLRLVTTTAGRDVVLVGGTCSEADTLELYDLACGLVDKGARSLTLVIPWFGCATMERVTLRGEIVTAKTRARLFSSVPVPGSGSRVLLLDLHSDGIPYYFEGATRAFNLSARRLMVEAMRRFTDGPFVLACTDAGRAKWVESLANELNVPAAFVFKRRLEGGKTQVTAVSAQVAGQHVVIYDDMIRTGGSLLNAALAYRDAGAARISAFATHGVLPGDALSRLAESKLFDRIVCTDSHPRALALRDDFLQVEPVASVFAEFLKAAS
jgi:ribose-phosphate pyrophosphokinase